MISAACTASRSNAGVLAQAASSRLMTVIEKTLIWAEMRIAPKIMLLSLLSQNRCFIAKSCIVKTSA
jgi:hypothetical protein